MRASVAGRDVAFVTPAEHLAAWLDRLDAFLRLHLADRRRAGGDLEGADALADATPPTGLEQREALTAPEVMRLHLLARTFGLTGFERDLLLLAVAPEVDARFEALYAHLHDDAALRLPTVGLALDLLVPDVSGVAAARARLAQDAPLRRWMFVRLQEAAGGPGSQLRAWLKADDGVVDYLLGQDDLDPALIGFVRRVPLVDRSTPSLDAVAERLAGVVDRPGTLVQLCGPTGSGGVDVAAGVCRRRGLGLLELRGDLLADRPAGEHEMILTRTLRQARLQPAALLWRAFSRWIDRTSALLDVWPALSTHPLPILLRVDAPWRPAGLPASSQFICARLPELGAAEQLDLWRTALGPDIDADELARLSSPLHLRPGQLRAAAAEARGRARMRGGAVARVTADDISDAARAWSRPNLGQLATLRDTSLQWTDLVLPQGRIAQLQALAARVRLRDRVMREWGFAARLPGGRGTVALFTGPPGTGKTLAAAILAREAGIELFSLDLSSVVSKYIGETEKNLERIFAEAERGHVALFFDEADAMFGKRSEVKDSRDRYANMEVSYLLQRVEAYDGLVILASNYRQNLDAAFQRRIHAIVEFPLPDEDARRRIWAGIWPADTPLAPDVDPRDLARRFELSGGDIHNSALDAAFTAAARGSPVSRADVLEAVRRTLVRGGHVVDERRLR